ncbi:MAG: GNAT family N-acetyltransferase [Clostridia bacterium]|nr:GNAT family N-acetyltransferase [Clostridia bacterium]
MNLFPRGTLIKQLSDAYSFDQRWEKLFSAQWAQYDDFFFDNEKVLAACGFVTCLDGKPIGHISWDPRNAPKYVIIGHNCILTKFKGKGFGKKQLSEAVRRIKERLNPQKIIVSTNANLIARYNYESVGFELVRREENKDESAFSGDYLYYEMKLR